MHYYLISMCLIIISSAVIENYNEKYQITFHNTSNWKVLPHTDNEKGHLMSDTGARSLPRTLMVKRQDPLLPARSNTV